MSFSRQNLGHGIGLRSSHADRFLSEPPPVEWLEVITENVMADGGRPLAVLEKVRHEVPVVLHGVSLSLGSADGLSEIYLRSLRQLVNQIEPAYVSDHLCWGAVGGEYAHDLLPLPFTSEALKVVVSQTRQVQDTLQRQIMIENVSSYIQFAESEMSEWEFLSQVAEQADCGILLDVNNIYVSSKNHGFDAEDFISGIPVERVGQFHLAGHSDCGTHLLDTHDAPVTDPVWDLYRSAVMRFGRVPTLIEWDDQIPPLERLVEESRRAQAIEALSLNAMA